MIEPPPGTGAQGLTDGTHSSRIIAHMLEAGQSREFVIAENVIDGSMMTRLKAACAIRLPDGGRLFDPGADDAGRVWFKASILAAILYGARYSGLTWVEMEAEIANSIAEVQAIRTADKQRMEASK